MPGFRRKVIRYANKQEVLTQNTERSVYRKQSTSESEEITGMLL